MKAALAVVWIAVFAAGIHWWKDAGPSGVFLLMALVVVGEVTTRILVWYARRNRIGVVETEERDEVDAHRTVVVHVFYNHPWAKNWGAFDHAKSAIFFVLWTLAFTATALIAGSVCVVAWHGITRSPQ